MNIHLCVDIICVLSTHNTMHIAHYLNSKVILIHPRLLGRVGKNSGLKKISPHVFIFLGGEDLITYFAFYVKNIMKYFKC